MPDFQDRILKCVDCAADFVFTAGEQQFYYEKEFRNEPKRCKTCKAKRTSGAGNGDRERSFSPAGKVETSAVCSQCGRSTTVPFRPTQGRPVFCRECFQNRKVAGATAG